MLSTNSVKKQLLASENGNHKEAVGDWARKSQKYLYEAFGTIWLKRVNPSQDTEEGA